MTTTSTSWDSAPEVADGAGSDARSMLAGRRPPGEQLLVKHRAFKASGTLRIGLAAAGSMAFQGPIMCWVADHRRHHCFADKDGDPHSPWLFGTTPAAVAKGFVHAHLGWLFDRDRTNAARFAPHLLADPDIRRVNASFLGWSVASLTAPAALGGLLSWSRWGALTALFWAGLVRSAVLHHVTWSINSICHMIGTPPFTERARSTNLWPLAIRSMGESWHNLHHADPTCARHSVGRGELDIPPALSRCSKSSGASTTSTGPRAGGYLPSPRAAE